MISGPSEENDLQKQKDKNTEQFFSILRSATSSKVDKSAVLIDLIKKGINVNSQNKNGYTPMILCVSDNHIEVMKYLIESGADLNKSSGYLRMTPLHAATTDGNVEMVELLINSGAKIDDQDHEGHTSLHRAIIFGQNEIAQLLLAHGANTEIKDNNGNTALHCCIPTFARLDTQDQFTAAVRMLLKNKAEIDAQNNDGETPLHLAVLKCPDIAQLLLNEGADFNIVNKAEQTPLKKLLTIQFDSSTPDCIYRLMKKSLAVFINKFAEAGWERFDILRDELGEDFAEVKAVDEMVNKIVEQEHKRIVEIIGIIDKLYPNAAKLTPASLISRLLDAIAYTPLQECVASSSLCIDDEQSPVIAASSIRKRDERDDDSENEEYTERPRKRFSF